MTITLTPTVPINQWPAERDRHGLAVLSTAVEYDESGCMSVTLMLEPVTRNGEIIKIACDPIAGDPKPCMPVPSEMDMPQQPKTLRDLMTDMLARASADPGIPKRAFLGGGLRIDLLVKDGHVNLQLSRQRVDPSLIEWKTTLKHLPDPVEVEPVARKYQGRHYLIGSWTLEDRSSE
jgi:hypothetical protein